MSISNNYVPIKQFGDGTTTIFSGSWPVIAAAFIRVYLEDVSTGVQTLQNEGSDYTLTFNSSGFTVTFITAPTSANYVVIGRVVSIDQSVPYTTSKGFDGGVTENSFDKLTAIDQDQQDEITRALKFPLGSTLVGVLPDTAIDGYGVVWSGTTGTLRNTSSSLSALEGNAQIVADNIDDINTVAGIETEIIAITPVASDIPIVAANISSIENAAAALNAVLKWSFDDTTTMSEPPVGELRLNNATISSVTAVALNDQNSQSGNPDIGDFIDSWDLSTNGVKGQLKISNSNDQTVFAIFNITAIVDNTSWHQITVSFVDGNGTFADDDVLYVSFSQAGDAGAGVVSITLDEYTDGVDYTSGSTTQLSLSATPTNENFTDVYFDGVYQHKSTYSLSGSTITFGSAIPLGTNAIDIKTIA